MLSVSNVYPFGMLQRGRNYQTDEYRYGFNGMEKDDEVNGGGNSYNFEGRSLYDGRLGQFVSVDPRYREYAWQSPYAYFKNSPIHQIDYKGLGDDDAEVVADQPAEAPVTNDTHSATSPIAGGNSSAGSSLPKLPHYLKEIKDIKHVFKHIWGKITRGEKYNRAKGGGGGQYTVRRTFELNGPGAGGMSPAPPDPANPGQSLLTLNINTPVANATNGTMTLGAWLAGEQAKPSFLGAMIQVRVFQTSDSDAGVGITTDYTLTINSTAGGGVINQNHLDDNNGNRDRTTTPMGNDTPNSITAGSPFLVNQGDNIQITSNKRNAGGGQVDQCSFYRVEIRVFVQHQQP